MSALPFPQNGALAFAPLSKSNKKVLQNRQRFTIATSRYLFHVWQTAQFAVYGTCMAKHQQRFD